MLGDENAWYDYMRVNHYMRVTVPRRGSRRIAAPASLRVYRVSSLTRNCFHQDPTVGSCLGPYGGPRGVQVSYEQGTPVGFEVWGFIISGFWFDVEG